MLASIGSGAGEAKYLIDAHQPHQGTAKGPSREVAVCGVQAERSEAPILQQQSRNAG
jgi:hypothetical protein